jgi:hypothetical protein
LKGLLRCPRGIRGSTRVPAPRCHGLRWPTQSMLLPSAVKGVGKGRFRKSRGK